MVKQDVTILNKIIYKYARITNPEDNQPEQIKKIFPDISPVKKGDIVAIKIHPGEYGNTTHIRPVIVRTVVDMVIKEGGIPFVTDTTTLYKGMKLNAAELIQGAAMNGFTHASTNAPFIVADGLRGGDGREIKINGDVLDSITVASGIAEADSMIIISHGKGHPASGFGGAVKHLGMGCLDRAGKIKVHEVGKPSIDPEKCIQCGDCVEVCPWGAIYPPRIDHSKCCGELSCADACKNEAIIPPANASFKMQKRLGEAALGPIKALKGRIGYINWVYDLTPGCDCFNFSGERFVEDIGILAGTDPVAIDAATIDLINERMKINGKSMYHLWGVDPSIHLEAAEKIGCGSRKYSFGNL
ncbi:MAG: ferredoxin [Candidatus Methanoperedens nitroreducens]|uniref:Ferredoxin n=1 Tax=Candidatus Methanoperedens nitratireducens TaxID=1392998 RepID=A0A0P8DVG8_9EURY|nr:DUF362 domain-containing protein [Candidatus Methanoperedens sp. BLZ2]KAB2941141.1 MAG: DUF362 domain-containing protein [Candidatus Methanoperedens sp.]KPQ41517.1 MAG: ferredoxin [Candidatus Methanoperedens sp. BLZ1]MBZ0176429.1 DUF362 domain-containing protein [Candidatus Methanoperedens nitroreducens]CAG0976834.1 hypothetical protein METP2_01720 [Methanosarcinales archaeon]MCX9079726.1 DUF362 domain-containing protein [Candidatus Methanoperedens sp.]